MSLPKALALIFLIGAPSISSATCEFYEGHSMQIITVQIPPTLSIPRDAVNGTVIFESPTQTYNGSASFKCSTDWLMGVRNNRGSNSPTSRTFPIENTGLSWQWIYWDNPSLGEGGKSYKAGGYGHNGSTNGLRIIKTGDIGPGTSISAGIMGYMMSDTLATLALQINGNTSITLQSCETPDVRVEMGEFNLSTFTELGKFTNPHAFSIDLRSCPSGINKVSYTLTASAMGQTSNPDIGIVELNQSSTAKGIGLQILDGSLEPIKFGKNYVFTEYNSSGGSFSIPMNARYIRTLPNGTSGQYDQGMSAGTANSELTFTMSYL